MSQVARPEDFGVIVLNYNDYESSITCVRSWLACDPLPPIITVVDNRSGNDSLEQLQQAFAGESRVEVIDSGHNGGYSFGNNVGIRRVREFGCRHAVIATSDTKVLSRHLLTRLAEETDSSTGVIAPQIESMHGHDNPSVANLNLRYVLDTAWLRMGMPLQRLREVLAARLRRLRRQSLAGRQSRSPGTDTRVRKVFKLHGAFLCLAEPYLDRVGLMEEDIFMFCEEDIFAYQCVVHGLEQKLVGDVSVHHAHDSSVALTHGNQASAFVRKHRRNSCRVLRREISMSRLIGAWWRGRNERS